MGLMSPVAVTFRTMFPRSTLKTLVSTLGPAGVDGPQPAVSGVEPPAASRSSVARCRLMAVRSIPGTPLYTGTGGPSDPQTGTGTVGWTAESSDYSPPGRRPLVGS